MKTQLLKQKAAFSLIETIIAISVLAMVLLFSVSLGSVSLRNMVVKAQTTQATSLARSGIEKVRNMRDNSWQSTGYTSSTCVEQWDCWVDLGHTSEVMAGNQYVLIEDNQYYLTAGNESSANAAKNLEFGDNSQVEYKSTIQIKQVSPFGSPFEVLMDQANNTDSKPDLTTGANTKIYLIESRVTWSSYGRPYQVVLKTYLTDWLPRF